MKSLTLIVTFFITGCISINKVESRKVDDGSSNISESEMKYLHPFDIQNLDKKDTIAFFETINASQIKEIAKRKNNLVVCVIATWCPVCHSYLAKIQGIKDSINSQTKNSDLIVISQNFNITYEQKLLKKYSFFSRSYILDPKQYGIDELNKQDSLMREFKSDHVSSSGSVPFTFILNRTGEIQFEIHGKDVSAELLISKFKQ